MKAKRFSEVKETFQPTENDDHSVVVIQYDKWKAFSDDDYITTPYKFNSLDEMILLPEHKGGSNTPSCTKTVEGGSTETSKNPITHRRGFQRTKIAKFTAGCYSHY